MKKRFCLYFFFIILLFPLSSQVVLVSCMENKHSEKLPGYATLYFENKLLDFLFNKGLIVTNMPYVKLSMEDYQKLRIESLAIEDEPEYLIMLYFLYEQQKKYDEFKKRNLLPCKEIYCKMLKKESGEVLHNECFVLEEISGVGLYKKLDFCLDKIEAQIVNNIRGKQ